MTDRIVKIYGLIIVLICILVHPGTAFSDIKVYDANGQFIGIYVGRNTSVEVWTWDPNQYLQEMNIDISAAHIFFHPPSGAFIRMVEPWTPTGEMYFGAVTLYYETIDCSGPAYVYRSNPGPIPYLYFSGCPTEKSGYIYSGGGTATLITVGSQMSIQDPDGDGVYECICSTPQWEGFQLQGVEFSDPVIKPVEVDLNLPIAFPLRFESGGGVPLP